MENRKRIKNCKEYVEQILKTDPRTRDSDELLACYVYEKYGYSWKMTFAQIMKAIVDGNIPTMETITRCRRKMQEEYPELRGEAYEKRNNLQENYVDLARGNL